MIPDPNLYESYDEWMKACISAENYDYIEEIKRYNEEAFTKSDKRV